MTTLSAVLLLLLVLTCVQAGSVLLFPAADTTLSQNWVANNFGGLPFVNAGTTQNFTTNRALIKFEVSQKVPAGSLLTAATLVWDVTREPGDGYNLSEFGLYSARRDWGEGDNVTPPGTSPGSGAPADARGAPGGAPGLDYELQPSASTTMYGVRDSPYTFGSTAGMVADVQRWLDDPQNNFGWMLISQAETLDFTARRFGSREDPLNSPYLLLDFVAVPEPGSAPLLLLGLTMIPLSAGLAQRSTARSQRCQTGPGGITGGCPGGFARGFFRRETGGMVFGRRVKKDFLVAAKVC